MENYDLLVIGGVSGGLAAAKRAASYGVKVALFEGDKLGGTCVIRGCVPKKLMSYAAQTADILADAGGFGFNVTSTFNFGELVKKRDAEVARLNTLHKKFLAEAGVEFIPHFARFSGKSTLEAGGKTYQGKHIIVATGSTPFMPDLPGVEHAITSDGLWEISTLPERLAIVGGGYIGLEFASIFSAFGTKVDVILRSETILNGFDEDIQKSLMDELQKRGVTFHKNTAVTYIEKPDGNTCAITLNNGSILHTNHLLFATGRVANTQNLELGKAGISTGNRGEICVSKHLLAKNSVYAVGDVTNRVNLTPSAIKDGRMVADNLYAGKSFLVDDSYTTSAIFTSPPAASCGYTEKSAIETYGENGIFCLKTAFKPMAHALTKRDEKCMIKLVFTESEERLIGAHMVGKDTPEIMQSLAIAVRLGATLNDLNKTLAIHPSTAEEIVLMRRTK